MIYKILADIIVVMHFVWILFILSGFIFTLCGLFSAYLFPLTLKFQRISADRWKGFFDRWLFRTVHLCGLVYVGLLTLLREYCPLTILENTLRARYNPQLRYPGSFIVHYIEKLVYPDVNSLIILIPTVIIAIFTIVIFIIRPPERIKRIFT